MYRHPFDHEKDEKVEHTHDYDKLDQFEILQQKKEEIKASLVKDLLKKQLTQSDIEKIIKMDGDLTRKAIVKEFGHHLKYFFILSCL